MGRHLWLCFSLLVLCVHSEAKGIKAVVAHSIFYQPDSVQHKLHPYVEASWEIAPASLHYTKAEGGYYIGKFKTDIYFLNENNDTVKQDHDILQTRPNANAMEITAQRIIDLRRYSLPAGKTTMRLFLTDLIDTANRFSYKDTFTLTSSAHGPLYSDLELLDTAYASANNNVFQKNGQQLIPLSTNFYDEKKNTLHYYVELYDLSNISKEELPLVQHVFISRKENEAAFGDLQRTDTITPAQFFVSIGDLDLSTLGSGNFYLNVALTNSLHKLVASRSLFFQRFNPNPVKPKEDTLPAKTKTLAEIEDVNVLDLNKTFVAKFSYAQTRAVLKMLLPVSDPADVRAIQGFLKKPDEMYMRYYIYNHFSYLNKKDPEAAWNEFAVRVREVNKLFGNSGTPGYETDRGGVYLRYGKPEERVIVNNEPGAYPYEIWQYNAIQLPATGKSFSNGIFLFYKPADQVTNFILLHSNVPGETQNLSWRGYLYTNSGNTNSRAEQYLPQGH